MERNAVDKSFSFQACVHVAFPNASWSDSNSEQMQMEFMWSSIYCEPRQSEMLKTVNHELLSSKWTQCFTLTNPTCTYFIKLQALWYDNHSKSYCDYRFISMNQTALILYLPKSYDLTTPNWSCYSPKLLPTVATDISYFFLVTRPMRSNSQLSANN